MKQAIDFRELLERVLPLEQLHPGDRSQVERALRSGVSREVEAAALLAMEQLEDRGALRRIAPSHGHERVTRFQPRDSHDIITVEIPEVVEKDGVFAHPRSRLPHKAPDRKSVV